MGTEHSHTTQFGTLGPSHGRPYRSGPSRHCLSSLARQPAEARHRLSSTPTGLHGDLPLGPGVGVPARVQATSPTGPIDPAPTPRVGRDPALDPKMHSPPSEVPPLRSSYRLLLSMELRRVVEWRQLGRREAPRPVPYLELLILCVLSRCGMRRKVCQRGSSEHPARKRHRTVPPRRFGASVPRRWQRARRNRGRLSMASSRNPLRQIWRGSRRPRVEKHR